ncbi:MAG: DUF4388 domain-containing protein [Acidimicrobiales bacterium]
MEKYAMSLQGTLNTLGITEVLEFLADRESTGRLDVNAGSGHATFRVHDGQIGVVEYDFERESGIDPSEATYYALAELEGSFYFDDDDVIDADDDTRTVSDVLSRTAEIAEAWAEIEDVIPTQQHHLVRNQMLDGSVMIEPEWWRALEIISDGSSASKLATTLDEGALSASTIAMHMAQAGLISVEEPAEESGAQIIQPDAVDETAIEPVEIPQAELPIDQAEDEPTEIDDHVDTATELASIGELADQLENLAAASVAPDVAPDIGAIADATIADIEESWDAAHVATNVVDDAVEAPSEPVPTVDVVPEPQTDVVPEPQIDDDDGWATDHAKPATEVAVDANPEIAPAEDFAPVADLQPAPVAAEPAPAPVIEPVAELVPEPVAELEPEPVTELVPEPVEAAAFEPEPMLAEVGEPAAEPGMASIDAQPSPFDTLPPVDATPSPFADLSPVAEAPLMFDTSVAYDPASPELAGLGADAPRHDESIDQLRDEMIAAEEQAEEFDSSERSSVLKFLRRD